MKEDMLSLCNIVLCKIEPETKGRFALQKRQKKDLADNRTSEYFTWSCFRSATDKMVKERSHFFAVSCLLSNHTSKYFTRSCFKSATDKMVKERIVVSCLLSPWDWDFQPRLRKRSRTKLDKKEKMDKRVQKWTIVHLFVKISIGHYLSSRS